MVNPATLILEAFKLVDDAWSEQGVFSANDTICIEPFEAVSLTLQDLLS